MITYVFNCFKREPLQKPKEPLSASVCINGYTYNLRVKRCPVYFDTLESFLCTIAWNILSFFRHKEYQLIDQEGKVISRLRIMPKIFAFQFMSKNGLHIGPSYTDPEYRGKGLNPELRKIMIKNETKYNEFFTSVKTTNVASLKANTKAGFIPFAYGSKSIFGISKIIKPYEQQNE